MNKIKQYLIECERRGDMAGFQQLLGRRNQAMEYKVAADSPHLVYLLDELLKRAIEIPELKETIENLETYVNNRCKLGSITNEEYCNAIAEYKNKSYK